MIKIKIILTCNIKPEQLKGGEFEDTYAEFDSLKTINDLKKAIESHDHSVIVINADDQLFNNLNKYKNEVDLVFNIAEGLNGEFRESLVQTYCEHLNIPYHGSGPLTAALTLNKAKTKEVLIANDIPTPKFQVFYTGKEQLKKDLRFPLLLKPLREGSSKGIFNDNLVDNEEKLKTLTNRLLQRYNQPVIVEEFLTGREFTVSVIGYHRNLTVLPIVEINFEHLPEGIHHMDSYEAKWIYDNPQCNQDSLICPAKLNSELKQSIEKTVRKTFTVLACKDWARIDLRLDQNNLPHVLEVNALPGLMKDPKENSRLPRAAYTAGWTYEQLIGEVLNSAIKRWKIKKKKKIAVLYTARNQSLFQYNDDWEGRENNEDKYSVVKVLQELGHEVKEFIVNSETYNILDLEKNNIDLVFNLCDDGFFSNSLLEPHLPAILDILKIPYTGSNYFSLSLCLNKAVAKSLFLQNNIPSPNFQFFETESDQLNPCLRFPLIVKPLREDASIGIKDESIVQDETALINRVKFVLQAYKQPALVEEFIDGREFNVGIIGNKTKEVLPISEINFIDFPEDKPKIVGYAAKWKEDSIEYKKTVRQCPANIDEQLKNKLIELAQQAANVLFCQDYCRVDFRVDKNNNPYVLEVNPNPDISEDAGLAAMASAQNYQYKELIDKIIKSALSKREIWKYNEKNN